MTAIQFKTAAQETQKARNDEDDDVVEVDIDGEVYPARIPSVDELAMVMIDIQGENMGDRIAGVWSFIAACFDEDDEERIKARIRSRRDGLTLAFMLTDVMPGMMEAFSGNFPTQPSTGSSGSPASSGRRSTGRSPGKGSTRSTSRPAAS